MSTHTTLAAPHCEYDPTAATIKDLKAGVAELESPRTRADLYMFLRDVRGFLGSSQDTLFLLDPHDTNDARVATISRYCAWFIKECLPPYFAGIVEWPSNTYDLLELLSSKAYSPFISEGTPSSAFPQRSEHEDMSAYLERFKLWQDCYFPDADSSPSTVRSLSGFIWHSHNELYDLSDLSHEFQEQLGQINTIQDVIVWYDSLQYLENPITPKQSKNNHSNKRQNNSLSYPYGRSA